MSAPRIRLTDTPSPITTEIVALAGCTFSELKADGTGGIYFCCRDPSNQGKTCIQSVNSTDGAVRAHTAPEGNVRSAVHEYGGGAYCVYNRDGLIYTDFPSHTLYCKKSGSEEATQIFPVPGSATKCRFADFSVMDRMDGTPVLLAVMEDHSDPNSSGVVNSVVTVSLDGQGRVEVLASGHDFYTYPCYDAASNCIAYVAWNHPNMPWDSTTLYVQDCDGKSDPVAVVVHAGASVYAPQWWNGKLFYLSNITGWYNLYSWKPGSETPPAALYPMEADFSETACGWILGIQCYTFLSDGTLVATYTPQAGDGSRLVLIDATTGAAREFGRSCLPPTSIWSVRAASGARGAIYFLGGSTTTPAGLWCWERPGDASCVAVQLVSSMQGKDLTTLQPFLSEPRHIRFPSDSTLGVGHAFGYYYPPIQQSKKTTPPLLVMAHGGPTASTSKTFRLDIQFWTSRGFAVLDVDYGGSTGYGKDFQQSLLGNWGLLDVADVCNGAKYCVEQGWANPDYLCIDGKSAGGYTTLAALAFADTFRAGASLFGVGDLSALAEDTHKFESRYLDGLIAPYPEKKDIYDERCPVLHTDKFNCPVILLQGDEDLVVPPDQAESMFAMLTSKGIPSALVIYKGEQHGFRKSANISHALLSEYFFYCEIFGIEPQPEGDFSGVKVGARVEV